jgi:hypothetical protein
MANSISQQLRDAALIQRIAGHPSGGGAAPTGRKQQLKDRILMDEIQKSMPPQISRAIAKSALDSQIVKKHKSIYSAVRFQFTPGTPAAGVTTYTLKATSSKIRAFSYGIGDDMGTAGFSSTLAGFGQATEAETNLISKNDTNGAVIKVTGVSLYLSETSDAALAKLVWANTFVDTTLDGVNQYLLIGRMGRIPSAGGLYGNGDSLVTQPGLTSQAAQVGVVSNGMPQANNFLRLGEPIWWHPASKTDSKFQIRFQVVRDLSIQAASRTGAAGVTAYTPPANLGDPGTFVDVVVYLQCTEYMKRSKQQ